MSKKYDASIYLTLDSEIKDKFFDICEKQYVVPSMLLRKWIANYVKQNGDVE